MEDKEKNIEEKEVSTKVAKNKEGYGYKYTDLAQIHEYLESINARYIQKIERIEGEDYIFTKRCFNKEWENEWIQGCKIVDAVLSGIKNPAQEQGSALTYARRYSLLMAFGLATEDDDAQSLTMPSISTIEEAKAYKLTFGKYAGKSLSEVPENYLQWLFENTKDETIRTACDFIMSHATQEDVDLLAEMEQLILATDTDREKLYKNYKVNSNAEMTEEQIKNAIELLKKKMNKENK